MVDAISSPGRDVEQANPAYLYRGPLTRDEEGNAGPASASGVAKAAKGAFGVSGLAAAMQVWRLPQNPNKIHAKSNVWGKA